MYNEQWGLESYCDTQWLGWANHGMCHVPFYQNKMVISMGHSEFKVAISVANGPHPIPIPAYTRSLILNHVLVGFYLSIESTIFVAKCTYICHFRHITLSAIKYSTPYHSEIYGIYFNLGNFSNTLEWVLSTFNTHTPKLFAIYHCQCVLLGP